MSRAPTLLLLALLLATPLAAAQDVQPGSVWTVFTEVDAVVRDNYATVKVVADIRNQGPDPEFPFVVRVPDDAFVTGLIIERDGTVYEAEIKDREAARQEYEAWKAQEQTGGLVEKTRRTSVYSYLINVAEFTSVRATLTYERYLAADRGVYNLSLEAPVSGFGRDLGARFTVKVSDADGAVALWGEPAARARYDECPSSGALTVCGEPAWHMTHEVGPRDGVESPTPFTASYTLLPTDDAGRLLTTVVDGQGYFAHRFRAPADAQQLPMDLVMVLDVSGSMAGLKLQQMIDAAKQVVGSLHDEDRLHLVSFSSDARAAWTGLLEMTPENRKRAAREIDGLFDGGGTNIESGLRRGFAGFAGAGRICGQPDASASSPDGCGIDWAQEEGRFPAFVLLTDGQPTAGVTGHDQLLELAETLNTRDVPVFGIAFGDDADWTLIRQLAQDGEGAAIRVPLGQGAEVDLRRFMAALTTPVLRDVRVEYSAGVEASQLGAPVLFAGSELLVIGTYDPARGIRGTVSGWAPEGERSYAFSGGEDGAALSFLPRLVAYHEVRELQETEAADGATASTTARIVELALRHGFVTDHTSLVLTLPPRDAREWTPANDETGDTRMIATGSSAPDASSCAGCSTARPVPTTTPTAPMASRISGLDSSADGTRNAEYGNLDANGPPTPASAPEAAVPGVGAGVAVLVLAAAAMAFAGRRSSRR